MALKKGTLLYGVGISNKGSHPRNLQYFAYVAWLHMLRRCYDPNYSHATFYKNCSVCDSWKTYQTFADWYVQQKGALFGWEVDKDLLSFENKTEQQVYSPEYCVLLPGRLNKVLISCKNKEELGFDEQNGRFYARCRDENSKKIRLGGYSTRQEATKAYIAYKVQVLFILANTFKSHLDAKAFKTLTNFNFFAEV